MATSAVWCKVHRTDTHSRRPRGHVAGKRAHLSDAVATTVSFIFGFGKGIIAGKAFAWSQKASGPSPIRMGGSAGSPIVSGCTVDPPQSNLRKAAHGSRRRQGGTGWGRASQHRRLVLGCISELYLR